MPSIFARIGLAALAAAALALPAHAQTQAQAPTQSTAQPQPQTQTQTQTFNVWPDVAPGSEGATQIEVVSKFPSGAFEVVRNVTRPTLEVFRPEPGTATGAAVIIAPGGGFRYLTMQAEGSDVARRLAAHGVTALVLKYRTLATPVEDAAHWRDFFVFMAGAAGSHGTFNMDEAAVPGIADGLQALHLVRQRAAEWSIDPTRVGMIGFSAGAKVTSGAVVAADPAARPAFAGLIYGAAFNNDPLPAGLPPVFLAVAGDDRLAAPTVMNFYTTVVKTGQQPELHIYAKGGHGFGMNYQGTSSDFWINDFLNWLEVQKLARP